jgi:hypothetical protein
MQTQAYDHTLAAKAPARQKLAAQMAEYEALGKKVSVLQNNLPSTREKVATYNNRPPRRTRRELEQIEAQVAEHGRTYAAIGIGVETATKLLRKHWLGRYVVTQTRVEQLAALHGYAYGGGSDEVL